MKCKGAIFDLDGVITSTASAHTHAWKEMFDGFLKKRAGGKQFKEFTEEDYRKYVDGKPRYEGAQSFFKSRGINLPFGDPKDSPDAQTVCGLGNKKNEIYNKSLAKQKPHVFPKVVDLIKKLRKAGIKTAVASSSKNCEKILRITKLYHLFDVHVDGNTLQRLGIKGKPEPDMFLHAAKQIHARPGECIIFEDAISGIQAGNKGNFGLVVGVAPNKRMLPGADLVFRYAGSLTLNHIKNWFSKWMDKDSWSIKYHGFDEASQGTREALTTVGNGYLGTRGCHETQRAGEHHYPGCYLANIFNKPKSIIKNKDVFINTMVNCPNWLLTELHIGKKKINPFKQEMLFFESVLDLKHATLHYTAEFKEKNGRITRMMSERFASMHDPHIVGLKVSVTPVNYKEKITITSWIDGSVKNENADRYKDFTNKHLKVINTGKESGKLYLKAKTTASPYSLGYAANHIFHVDKEKKHAKKVQGTGKIGELASARLHEGESFVMEKVASIYSSNDTKQPMRRAASHAHGTYEQHAKRHREAWQKLWTQADIIIEGDRLTQRLLRLHTYHLLCTASPHNERLDAGMPARGLSGESYHGHIFWDEIYTQPFYGHRFPEIAKALLQYRRKRLPQARTNALLSDRKGAMYPWQSADTGEEETQPIHFNPRDGKWGPDLSRNQRHVSIAIYYNFYQYLKHTKDEGFLAKHAMPVMVDIARFWTSMASYDAKDKQYHISGVMGPDEFHERMPGSAEEGLTDNAYTNVMVSWLLQKTLSLIGKAPEAVEKLQLSDEEVKLWEVISEQLAIHVKRGIVQQFKGYDTLKELDWEQYRKQYGNISRMDRILKAEGKSPDDYKLAKQADFLMVFYLLDLSEAVGVLRRLGVKVDNPLQFLKKHYDYYEKRTTHGSTLSKMVHDAIISQFHDRKKSWEWFSESLQSDFSDVQGGTTKEGIHAGMMAGTLRIAREDLAGIRITERGISAYPLLPKHWESVKLSIMDKGRQYSFAITQQFMDVQVNGRKPVDLEVHGRHYQLRPGKRQHIQL